MTKRGPLTNTEKNRLFPVFTFRMTTEDDGERLRRIALRSSGSVSEYVRIAVLEKLAEEGRSKV